MKVLEIFNPYGMDADKNAIIKFVKKQTGGSVTMFSTTPANTWKVEVNLSRAHDPELVGKVLKHLVKKACEEVGRDFKLVADGIRVSGDGSNSWAFVSFVAEKKLDEIVQAKPTAKELHDRDVYSDTPLEDGQVYVTENQRRAFEAYIMARFREMQVNTKHVGVNWSSSRQATAFPHAGIRFIVLNKKSELYMGTEQAELFPVVAKGLVKNAFRDVFGFSVKVVRDEIVTEYSNGLRYLDYKVTWA